MANPQSYVGSKISLISKSDVRYEGILYAIDAKESKVYLQDVRCFGTEDRRQEEPIPATDRVYNYIIFRGTDIKDLHVCEMPAPPQQPMQPMPQDPAIAGMGGGPQDPGYGMYGGDAQPGDQPDGKWT
eukprot:TRINITY_DN863_c1_g1_i1.p2 TRINITY_DN863_c1_g1~~TRINITY_DN863_c1_g1_i1.p2  ORF type:complete len:128 (+),score=15.25 TRINITY_DN863_c1_g1_i1:64-447(+)